VEPAQPSDVLNCVGIAHGRGTVKLRLQQINRTPERMCLKLSLKLTHITRPDCAGLALAGHEC
jgi:hypothetical protein